MNLSVTLNHETSLVLACACAKPDKKQLDRIIKAAQKNLNWNLVYEIALNQRVLPLLYINIKKILPDRAVDTTIKKFKNTYFSIATRNLYLSSYLVKIIVLFNTNNIKVLPIKGPVIAQDLYGDAGLRIFSDLDILVRKHDAEKAWAIFLKNGFQPELDLDDKQFGKFIKYEDNLSFFSKTGNISIELHWEMSGFYLSKPLRFDHVENGLKQIVINKMKMLNLSEEDLLIYLCIHGAKHGWEHLEQVCCVAEIIRKKNINWDIVDKTVLEWQCKRMFHLGLYLSWQLLDVRIPDSIIIEIKKDKKIPVLAQKVIACMFKKPLDHRKKNITNRFSSFHIDIRDSFTDKLSYVFRLIFCPTNKEWLNFPLPASISFLHYILRPIRLIKTGIKAKKNNA